MASSNIKLFDENKGNMLSDSEFSISNQRMNGLQTGVASSQLQNKAMYQASLVAYAIAQVMMQNGNNANDTDAVSAFVANLSGTMLQKVYDIATTAEAQAGVATGKWMSPALVKAAIDTLAAKAQNILSDATKALFGFGTDAVPDDVLALLSRFQNGLGNEYVWAKSNDTGIVGYVNSPDQNAYPPSVSDGYTYTALGQLGVKLQMEAGSYVGTGKYGKSNPNRITLSFVPKLVIVVGWCYIAAMCPTTNTYDNKEIADLFADPNSTYTARSSNTQAKIDGTAVYWYGSSAKNAQQQGNHNGYKYQYFAFG